MAAITCPMCNVRQVGSIIPLFIEYDGKRDGSRHNDSLEQDEVYSDDSSLYTEYQDKFTADVNSYLATRCKELQEMVTAIQLEADEKSDRLNEGQATIDELRERVAHLEGRERDLMALSRRHKLRMRRLQIKNDTLGHNIARMDEASGNDDIVHLSPETVLL
ncbi:hypothetical protein H4R27_000491 [Coemansia aciculifera]|nr:hypothetical protein H4R27_000491 [Coemansia aciculifera]